MSTGSYWRAKAAPIIARVLEETQGQPEAEIRKALRAAYPFGPRTHHPYKVWLDEIKVQRGQGRHSTDKARAEAERRIAEIREHNRRVSGEVSE